MAKLPEVRPAVHDAFMEGMCVVQWGDTKCYCGIVLDMSYHKTSACQYFWRVHTYATDALLAKLYDGKYELFRFIGKELQRDTADLHYELLTTNADLVLSNKPTDMTALSPCHQEEADTQMMLHLYHAAGQGHSKAFLRTVDSDVVVLAINIFHQLRLSALWIGYGIGKTCKDIPIHHISQIKCLDLNIVKCCPSSMLSRGTI